MPGWPRLSGDHKRDDETPNRAGAEGSRSHETSTEGQNEGQEEDVDQEQSRDLSGEQGSRWGRRLERHRGRNRVEDSRRLWLERAEDAEEADQEEE